MTITSKLFASAFALCASIVLIGAATLPVPIA